MEPIHVEEAREYLIGFLANINPIRGTHAAQNSRTHGCEVWIPNIVENYYHNPRQPRSLYNMGDSAEPLYVPFYDAAWELCRIGVLRPAETAPRGMGNSSFRGDGYSFTDYGLSWVKAALEKPYLPTEPSRFIEILKPFEGRFGKGFMQRAAEAVKCYRTNNYLACCVMIGGAAESIILSVAIAKTKDEEKVLKEYRAAKGRKNTLDRITGNIAKGVGEQFIMASGVLSFWRDEAAHGQITNISEVEAYAALAQLLRLAQSTTDNWEVLTANNTSN